jgi:Rv2525c-like, glycoside hydrolase-like domain
MSTRLASPILGLDSASRIPVAAHHKVNSRFACRYLSRFSWKVLTRQEASDLKAAGLGLVVVFEDSANDATKGFDRGRQDAQFALGQARSLGMPDGRPIYFAVDFDASPNPAATDRYFDGLASVLGHEGCGPYGGIAVVRRQLDRGFRWAWQTYAWSRHELDNRAQIYQFENGFTIHYGAGAKVGVDFDHAFYADYGQWWGVPGGVSTDVATGPTDPHHYLRFPDQPLPWHDKVLHERWLVQEYDRYRAAPHMGANEEMLDLLRIDLTKARKRVWYVAHYDPKTGRRHPKPTWDKYYRGWRWQQLLKRSRGERVV